MERFRDYKDWSQERLIQKVIQLEEDLKEKTSGYEFIFLRYEPFL